MILNTDFNEAFYMTGRIDGELLSCRVNSCHLYDLVCVPWPFSCSLCCPFLFLSSVQSFVTFMFFVGVVFMGGGF